MQNKKSQGLSLNMIIIAAIGLIVLVVLAYIFFGRSTIFVKSTGCTARGGICLPETGCPDDKPIKIYTTDCKEMELDQAAEKYKAKANSKDPGQCCISIT